MYLPPGLGFGGGGFSVLATLGIKGALGTAPLVVGGASLVFSVVLTGLAAVAGGILGVVSSVMECFLVGISGLL